MLGSTVTVIQLHVPTVICFLFCIPDRLWDTQTWNCCTCPFILLCFSSVLSSKFWSLLDCEVFRRNLLLWVHCSISEMRSLFLLSFVGGAWLYSFIIFVPSVLKVSLLEIICFPFVQTRQMRLNYVINPIYVSLQKLPMHNFLAHSNYVSVQCLRRWMMTTPILANENIWTCLGSETVDYVLPWFNSSMAPVNYWFSVPWVADPKALKYQP